MSKFILDNLFNSKIRLKVLRFLFRNYPGDFSASELANRIQEGYDLTQKEIKTLQKIGLIKRK